MQMKSVSEIIRLFYVVLLVLVINSQWIWQLIYRFIYLDTKYAVQNHTSLCSHFCVLISPYLPASLAIPDADAFDFLNQDMTVLREASFIWAIHTVPFYHDPKFDDGQALL